MEVAAVEVLVVGNGVVDVVTKYAVDAVDEGDAVEVVDSFIDVMDDGGAVEEAVESPIDVEDGGSADGVIDYRDTEELDAGVVQ